MNMLITIEELKSKRSRDLIPCKCKECLNTYYVAKNVVQRGLKGKRNIDFCSKQCFYHYRKRNSILHLECNECHKEFDRARQDLNYNSKLYFCSTKCSSIYFGRIRKPKEYHCKDCNRTLTSKHGRRCLKCYHNNKKEKRDILRQEYIDRWLNGLETGYSGKTYQIIHYIRRFLFKKYDSKCCKCGWDKINPTSNKIPLEVNHIDGNPANCKEENLELICPNCHALTPNFRALNKNSCRVRK